MQPHLRKCFEGIAKLKFDDKQKIPATISAEKEEVALDEVLVPANSNGMVEKWLNEVLQQMIASVRSRTAIGIETYPKTERAVWVKQHAGMVVLSASSNHWTDDIEDHIRAGTMQQHADSCTANFSGSHSSATTGNQTRTVTTLSGACTSSHRTKSAPSPT